MFKEKNDKIFVDTFAMEVYLPYDYLNKEYRGTPYYTTAGTMVRYFGVGNMRFFKTQKEMDNPLTVKTYTLGFPMIMTSEPSDIDIRSVQFKRGGVERKCIVLTFYKDDIFLDNVLCIANSNNIMILMNRLEGGKLDHVGVDEAVSILQDAQTMNRGKLKLPSEEEEIFIAERYRDPDHPSRRARFATDMDQDRVVSYNMRQEAMHTTTYQAMTHEDINTALITSINRKEAGIQDDPTIMERIVRGLDMSDLIAERDKRIEEEK